LSNSAGQIYGLKPFPGLSSLVIFYTGTLARGKDEIKRAFEAIAEYFKHSLVVKQGDMSIIESDDTALVISNKQEK
jgi:ketosteroid isomerase-like protein